MFKLLPQTFDRIKNFSNDNVCSPLTYENIKEKSRQRTCILNGDFASFVDFWDCFCSPLADYFDIQSPADCHFAIRPRLLSNWVCRKAESIMSVCNDV